MKQIPVSGGRAFALVDDEDYDALAGYTWSLNGGRQYNLKHVQRHGQKGDPTSKVYMHRAILDVGHGVHIDHVNGNPLDNRRENLRACTPSLNGANRKAPRMPKTSKYRGVSVAAKKARVKNPRFPVWVAQIKVKNLGGIHLGSHRSEEAAARAYDAAARIHFGEFARLNFPEPGERSALEVGDVKEAEDIQR